MPRPWQFAPHDRGIISRLTREMKCSPLLAQVLASRGYESGEQANAFLAAKIGDLHDPALLPGVSEAADRIVAAVKAGRRITIYGDYDVDGVTATSILWHCLQLSGATVDYYIPCRLEEGYGLNLDALRTLHEEDPQRLVVTVDCGICSTEEADLAAQLGLELIITDHHTMEDELPRRPAWFIRGSRREPTRFPICAVPAWRSNSPGRSASGLGKGARRPPGCGST